MTDVAKLNLSRAMICPHDHILVENNDTKHTCQKCGASMKYVSRYKYPSTWSAEAEREFDKWLGPHHREKLVVDVTGTLSRIEVGKDTREQLFFKYLYGGGLRWWERLFVWWEKWRRGCL